MTNTEDLRYKEIDEFSQEAQFALVGYQMVEEQIKSYICYAHKYIKNRLGDDLPYNYTDDEVDGYAMERLINIFKKLNDDKNLQQKLKKLPKDRNYIAHQAFAHAYIKRTARNESLEEETEKVADMSKFVWECFQELKPILESIENKTNER